MRIQTLLWLCLMLQSHLLFSSEPSSLELLKQAKAQYQNKQYDDALLLLRKAEFAIKNDSVTSQIDLFNIYQVFGSSYLAKEQFKKSRQYFEKAEELSKNTNTINPLDLAKLWNGYADLYLATEAYDKAGDYYLLYCNTVKDLKNTNSIIEELYFKNKKAAGTCCIFSGQIVKSEEIFSELVLEFPKDKYLKTQYSANSNLGYVYDELGRYDKAIEQYTICEEINSKLPIKETIATINLGTIYYLVNKDSESAKYCFNKVLNIVENNKHVEEDYYLAAKNLCTIYFQEEKYDEALKYINIALKVVKKNYETDLVLTNEILSEKGRILMIRGKRKEAEKLFDEANKNLSIDPNDESTYNNIPYTVQLYNVILHQAKAYMELYERTKDVEVLQQAFDRVDISIAIVNSARASLIDADSKRALMWSASAVFQVKVKILELLYQETNNSTYLNNAFELFEKTNNFILLEAILKNEVANRMGLPQEIFDQENELKTKLADAESKLYETEQSNPNNTTAIFSRKQVVANYKSKYQSFLKKLEANHSNYFNLNYNDEVPDIKQLQTSLLTEDQTLIHYYMSEEEIHCIAVNKKEADFFHIPNTNQIVEDIKTLRNGILNANKNHNSKSDLNELITASHHLYNALIKSIKIPLNKKLVIIPMGELSYLPFDVLLKETPSEGTEYYDYKFLLKDHAISYGYSSTLLNDARKKKIENVSKANFVGFAPAFNSTKIASNRSEMVSLLHNESEVNNINEIIGGDVFTDMDATKENFVKLCNQYKVLHLATHGVSNSDKGENSYLAFSEDHRQDGNSLLYARDIYNLNLETDLVVLSACETAIGELQLGEGIISLARAFTYAGARSSLTTLWQVNDHAASLIMEHFYNELKSGISKDEALRNAKLSYIEDCPNAFAHPFYWSAFIPIGDMSVIDIADNSSYMQYGMFGAFGFILLSVGYLGWLRLRGSNL